MCTSSSRSGAAIELSRSPCLTPSPPPPKKWHAPQLSRLDLPTLCAILARSMALSTVPDPGGISVSRVTTLPASPGEAALQLLELRVIRGRVALERLALRGHGRCRGGNQGQRHQRKCEDVFG